MSKSLVKLSGLVVTSIGRITSLACGSMHLNNLHTLTLLKSVTKVVRGGLRMLKIARFSIMGLKML